jgi:hypothetical protein
MGSTLVSLILGINRCFELYDSKLALKLFGGRRLFFWIGVPIVYMLYAFIFTPPPIFNSIMVAAFFNPHYMYFEVIGIKFLNWCITGMQKLAAPPVDTEKIS